MKRLTKDKLLKSKRWLEVMRLCVAGYRADMGIGIEPIGCRVNELDLYSQQALEWVKEELKALKVRG
ncbi:hypothetical protein ES703_81218 [subsurface metagenome]